MKPYPKYKPTNIDWIGEIPEHWMPKKLKYFAKIMNGKDYQEFVLEEGGYPVFGTGGIFARCSKYLHNRPSVLLGRKGSVENPQYTEESFWTSDTTYYTDIFDNTDPKFLFHLVKQINFGLYIYGSAIPSMTKSVYDEMVFPFPPLPEQQAIVSYLDQKTALIDELIAKKERKIELLKENRTALINHAVTKGLDPTVKYKDSGIEWIGVIPEHWEVNQIKRGLELLTDYDSNGSFSSIKDNVVRVEKNSDKFSWMVRATDLEQKTLLDLNSNDLVWVNSATHDFLKKSHLDGGELLIAKRGEIGKVYLMPQVNFKATLGPNMYLARLLDEKLNSTYVYHYFMIDIGKNQLKIRNKSTTIGALYKDDFKDILVIFPPIKEQLEIVEFLDSNLEIYDQNINLELQKIDKLKEYRQSLISNVVTGKICVLGD